MESYRIETASLNFKARQSALVGQPLHVGKSIGESRTRELPMPSGYEGLWVSQGGSLYLFDGTCFTCLHAHSAAFRGWSGRVAVGSVRMAGAAGSGMQAFRCGATGRLVRWVPVRLYFESDVVTKRFPYSVPASELVYGYQERYRRASVDRGMSRYAS